MMCRIDIGSNDISDLAFGQIEVVNVTNVKTSLLVNNLEHSHPPINQSIKMKNGLRPN